MFRKNNYEQAYENFSAELKEIHHIMKTWEKQNPISDQEMNEVIEYFIESVKIKTSTSEEDPSEIILFFNENEERLENETFKTTNGNKFKLLVSLFAIFIMLNDALETLFGVRPTHALPASIALSVLMATYKLMFNGPATAEGLKETIKMLKNRQLPPELAKRNKFLLTGILSLVMISCLIDAILSDDFFNSMPDELDIEEEINQMLYRVTAPIMAAVFSFFVTLFSEGISTFKELLNEEKTEHTSKFSKLLFYLFFLPSLVASLEELFENFDGTRAVFNISPYSPGIILPLLLAMAGACTDICLTKGLVKEITQEAAKTLQTRSPKKSEISTLLPVLGMAAFVAYVTFYLSRTFTEDAQELYGLDDKVSYDYLRKILAIGAGFGESLTCLLVSFLPLHMGIQYLGSVFERIKDCCYQSSSTQEERQMLLDDDDISEKEMETTPSTPQSSAKMISTVPNLTLFQPKKINESSRVDSQKRKLSRCGIM